MGSRDKPRPRPRGAVCCGVDDDRRDWGGCCSAVIGPGVRFMMFALDSTMREVTLSGRRNDVLREEVNKAVRRKSAMPWEKSGRNPLQSASDPAAWSKYTGFKRAF